jgi:hypothetical protein
LGQAQVRVCAQKRPPVTRPPADQSWKQPPPVRPLIQRFGSAANLNIHVHCPVLDGVYRRSTDGEPVFVGVPAPTDDAL